MERGPSSPSFQFPPGFRFHPSDEELIIHYLQKKVTSRPLPASIIAEIDLYKYNPWELPKKALFGDDEWYFFSPRDRKYPNGARPNRAAGSGYWKATGTDKPILTGSGSKNIGVKKALVFYNGRPPKGVKTDWIMNEYRLLDTTTKPSRARGSMRLDDWVLCRVRQKGSSMWKNTYEGQQRPSEDFVRNLPKLQVADPTLRDYTTDMITDCLSKDCPLMAALLAEEYLIPNENISCICFQESSKGNSSVYDDGGEKVSSPITVSSFDNYSPVKRKPSEEDEYHNLLPSNKKLSTGNIDENLLPSEILSDNDLSYYSQNQSQDTFYDPNPSDPLTSFLELTEFDFTASEYLHNESLCRQLELVDEVSFNKDVKSEIIWHKMYISG